MSSNSIVLLLSLALCGAILGSGKVSSASDVPNILDSREDVRIEQIAGDVCGQANDVSHSTGFLRNLMGYNTKQISRPSTVVRLSEYFEQIIDQNEQSERKLLECAHNNRLFLRKLKELMKVSNQNVCGIEKLILIEDIHRRYVSTAIEDQPATSAGRKEPDSASSESDLDAQVPPGAISNTLRLFFMHYAMEISAICKTGLINNLEWDLKELDFKEEYYNFDDNSLGRVMDGMASSFSSMTSVANYDDVILLWDIIEGSLKPAKSQKLATRGQEEEINPLTREEVKLYVKAANTKQLVNLQEKCRLKFRPVYEKLILPIITLADLGYSCNSERFEKEIKELQENELVRRWYIITQICETILPIMFVQDSSIPMDTGVEDSQIVIITREEAEELTESCPQPEVEADQEPLVYEPTTFQFDTSSSDKIHSVESVEAQQLVRKIRTNIDSRTNAIKRVMRRLTNDGFQFAKNKFRSIFYSDNKSKNKSTTKQPETTDVMEKLLSEGASMPEEQLLSTRGACRHHLVDEIERHRRHHRLGDTTVNMLAASQQIDHIHTKSWSRIWQQVYTGFTALLPGRFKIVLIGSALVMALISVIFVASMVALFG